MAGRAYAQAFDADPTNAEILWQRVQVLVESGRRSQADPLLRQLVEQSWDLKYDGIVRQAERVLAHPQ